MVVVFLLLFTNGIQAQTSQIESPRAGSEYNVLDSWSGIWNVQGEARDSMSAPYHQVDWTFTGQRILIVMHLRFYTNGKPKTLHKMELR